MTGLKDKELKGITVGNLITIITTVAAGVLLYTGIISRMNMYEIASITRDKRIESIIEDMKKDRLKNEIQYKEISKQIDLDRIQIERIKERINMK